MNKTIKLSDAYADLYHYTTWEGLDGILDSQCLWATHSEFMNDRSEGLLFREKLSEKFCPEVEKYLLTIKVDWEKAAAKYPSCGGKEGLLKEETETLVNMLYDAYDRMSSEIFITSFCAHEIPYDRENGLLSQWRGYGRGGGVAIIFDRLEEILLAEYEKYKQSYLPGCLGKVIYENKGDFDEEFGEEISKVISHIPSFMKAWYFSGKLLEKPALLDGCS